MLKTGGINIDAITNWKYLIIRLCLVLGLGFQPAAVICQNTSADPSKDYGGQPRVNQPFSNMTREELFLEVFKHPSPDITINSYVILIGDGIMKQKIKAIFSQDERNLRLEGKPVMTFLSQSLQPDMEKRIKQKIDAQGWITRSALEEEGLSTSFDRRKFIFYIDTDPEMRKTKIYYMSGPVINPYAVDTIRPSLVSAFLNFSGKSVARTWTMADSINRQTHNLGFSADSAINVAGIAVEGSAFGEAGDAGSSFRRGDVRMVYDRPKRATRYSAGDLRYQVIGYQAAADMGGISVSKDFSLDPYSRDQRKGQFEFYLERPAEVKVFINSSLTNTLQLAAGTHDIRGFSPYAGQNNVRLEIEDKAGQRQVLGFSFINYPMLLNKDMSLFSYNAGFRRELNYGIYHYNKKEPILSAAYLKGLRENTMLGGYTQMDPLRTLFGIQAVRGFSAGALQLDIASSLFDNSSWDMGAKVGLTLTTGAREKQGIESQISAEYRGKRFGSINDYSFARGNTINCLASLVFPLGHGISGNFSGNYTFAHANDLVNSYGASAALTRKWLKYITTSAALRHFRKDNNERSTEFMFMFGINFSGSLDAGNNNFYAASELEGDTTLGWNYRRSGNISTPIALASAKFGPDRQEYTGGAGYSGNQGTVEATYTQTKAGQSMGAYSGNETKLRLQSAVVFAAGTFALSRPVQENFVIVKGQNGLKDVGIKIDANSSGGSKAQSGWISPATLTDVPSYRLREIQIDPVNPPLGVTPDKTTFLLFPAYKSGSLLKLGKELETVAIGRLVDEQRKPLIHLPIEVRELNNDTAKLISTFTNRGGRFQIPNAKPGLYEIRSVSKTRRQSVIVKISESPDGLFRLGDVILPPI